MIRNSLLILTVTLVSACAKAPSCDDERVLDTVKSLQAKIDYSSVLKGATLGNLVSLPKGVEELFERAYTPDEAEITSIRVADADDERRKVTCVAQLSTKMDVLVHERAFKAGMEPIINANSNNFMLPMLKLGLLGLKPADTRSISYTAQFDTEGEVFVEIDIE
jgi:hypothetical protein